MNVVFDLGGVVVAWKPDDIVARVFADPNDRRIARHEIIGHPDWLAMDRGTMAMDEVIERAATRTALPESAVRLLVDSVPPSLVADAATLDLLGRIKAAGHSLYCLSNMPKASMDHLERVYSFWPLFSGLVISSRVGFCKPEPEIFAHLLAAYRLDASETIFVDDLAENVLAAERFGIRGIHFQSPVQCEVELQRLGLL